jgi:hypothetical protein
VKSPIAIVGAVMLVVGSAVSAPAAPLSFFGEDRGIFNQDGSPTGTPHTNSDAARGSFLTSLVGVGTETFESFLAGAGAPLALSFPGAGTATLSGGGAVDDNPGTGQNAISGTKWWRTGAGNDFAIDFSGPVAAFGFYGIDVGDIGAQLTLTLLDGSAVAINIPHTIEPGGPSSGQNGSVIFFGYIDTANPWTRAEFANVGGGGGDDFGFDNMTIGSIQQVRVVPHPSTLLLLGLTLPFLAGYGLRSRKGSA